MNTKLLVGLVVLALGAGVGWYVLQNNKAPSTLQTNDQTDQAVTTPELTTSIVTEQTGTPTGASQVTDKGGVTSDVMTKTTVSYTDSGFTPNSMTVKKGTTVTFVNNSSKGMWVGSDLHPTHQLLPGFDQLKSVQKGGTYEYTFIKEGTWTYHNHVGAADKGTVVVTQ